MTYAGCFTGVAARLIGWVAGVLLATPAVAVDTTWLRNTISQRTADYVRIDTLNPPGDTAAAVDFFADALIREGISFETVETAAGHVNIWARLPATAQGRRSTALMLLHHMDTAPASSEQWTYPPLSGELHDGRIIGRGSLANKSLGAMHLQAFIALHRSGVPLKRDVIFMAAAGQQDGGRGGLAWLVEHLPEVFADLGFVLTSGGYGIKGEEETLFHVEVGAKAPLWLRLRARETIGINTAAERLLDGLQRLRSHSFPLEVTPPIAGYFAALAPYQPEPWRTTFSDIGAALRDEAIRSELETEYPEYYDLLRNSCGISSVTVGPGRGVGGPVEARVDCQLLMHQNPRRTAEEIQTLLDGLDIQVETLWSHPSGISSTDTSVYRALVAALESSGADRHAVPAISRTPGTSHFLRERGIEVYGVSPLAVTTDELVSLSGPNESVDNTHLQRGVVLIHELLQGLAQAP